MYKDVERDVDRLIKEGYLVEFKNNDHLHQLVKTKNSNRKDGHRLNTLLYPAKMEDTNVEVRGTLGKYDQRSLNLLSKLWNPDKDAQSQLKNDEFDW